MLGQDIAGVLLAGGGFGAGREAEAIVAGFQNVAEVGEPIGQRHGHLGIAKDHGPFSEAEIGGDDDAAALVEFAQQMEGQCAAGGAEQKVSQQVEAHEGLGDLTRRPLPARAPWR